MGPWLAIEMEECAMLKKSLLLYNSVIVRREEWVAFPCIKTEFQFLYH